MSVNTDLFNQGTGSLSRRIDNTSGGFALDLGVGNELDFSPGGANEGDHIFFWVNIFQPESINGFHLRLSEDAGVPNAGNSLDYEIFPANPYNGGWYRVVLDPRVTPSVVNGSADHNTSLNAVRWIGFYFDMQNVGGTSANCLIDAIDIGRGLVVTGGTDLDRVTWDDIDGVASSQSNAYGLIEKRSGVFFMKGEWQFGDATNNCYFQDADETVVWEGNYTLNRNGIPDTISAVADDLNKLVVVEGTGTTDFISGIKSGVGDDATGSNGCTYQAAPVFDSVRTNLSIDFSDVDITNVELFGCRFRRCVGSPLDDSSIILSSDATNGPNHEVLGTVFNECGLINPGRVHIQDNTFTNSLQSSKPLPLEQITYEDNSLASFTDITNSVNQHEGAAINMWPLPGTSGDAIYLGLRDKFLGVFEIGGDGQWSDSISTPVWEYYDISTDAWESLGTVTETTLSTMATATTNLAGGPNVDGYTHTWSDPGANWGKVVVNSGVLLYFVRLRNGGAQAAGSGNANAKLIYALPAFNGAALLWGPNVDMTKSRFIDNVNGNANEKNHAIEHRFEGDEDYTGMSFTGNDGDILLTDKSQVEGNYSFAEGDTDQPVGDGTTEALAQSFTSVGGRLSRFAFNVKKTGTPTGNAVVKLYAHTGVLGTSSIPTSEPLATSETFDVATLTGSYNLISFDFKDNITLTGATNYEIVFEYTGGDISNFVQLQSDSSGPSHIGNFASFNGTTWTPLAGVDLLFSVWSGNLVISALSGSDPTTSTSVDQGQVIINNISNITLTNLVGVGAEPDTEVRVYKSDTTIEITGQNDVTTGSFTFQAIEGNVIDIIIHNVEYEYIAVLDFVVPTQDVEVPIQQLFDRNYNTP